MPKAAQTVITLRRAAVAVDSVDVRTQSPPFSDAWPSGCCENSYVGLDGMHINIYIYIKIYIHVISNYYISQLYRYLDISR